MTFSIVGRCARTGMIGCAIATGEMAVGSRCIHVEPNVGAVITQASTNPALGPLGLNLLRLGFAAERVVAEMAASDPFPESRQLGALDARGAAHGRTGAENRDAAGHRAAPNVLAAANAVMPGVVDAMFESFEAGADLPLWERLLRALEAGKDAGGQPNGERSAGLYVVDRAPFATVDLRVDLDAAPVAMLRRMADEYFPLIPYYQLRPTDPSIGRYDEWLARQGVSAR
jgi:uncharacterized Ntn-hydrolase superfamily protein